MQVWGVMHLTKNIIKIVARVVNNCYLLAERVREKKKHISFNLNMFAPVAVNIFSIKF